MANRDINLFKAAGGERAKGSKRSPMTYMVMFAIFVVVLAVGILAYFNIKANNAVSAYDESVEVGDNYRATKIYCKNASDEYLQVVADINSASRIDGYVEQTSKLYPHLTQTEIDAVKETILNDPLASSFDLNDPQDGENFDVWDYSGLRESLYKDREENEELAAMTDAELALYYFALKKVEDDQSKYPAKMRTNIWYSYYRNYFVMVFKGGDGEDGLVSLTYAMISDTITMDNQKPFSVLSMKNNVYNNLYDEDNPLYTPAKFVSKVYNEEVYNIVLMPVKSVVERMMDILEDFTDSMIESEGWETQSELARYAVDELSFSNEQLKFSLKLPPTVSFTGCMDQFAASPFFDVSESVKRFESTDEGDYISYEVILLYKDGVAEKQA